MDNIILQHKCKDMGVNMEVGSYWKCLIPHWKREKLLYSF